ncbi:cytochrome P450, partial [Wolfiporia cocos MD-104 SS10]
FILAASIGVAVLLCRLFLRASIRRTSSLPPGPKRLPLVGNVHQLPIHHQHPKLAEWANQYGDMIYLQVFHKPLLVIDSVNAAIELMEKRSAKYSDRPHATRLYANWLSTDSDNISSMGWDGTAGLLPYGDTWRMHIRWFQSFFREKNIPEAYHSMQLCETQRLLAGLLRAPEAFLSHIVRFSSNMVTEIAYGIPPNEEFSKLMSELNAASVEAGAPTATLFDLFPILSHIPSWLPCAGLKHRFTDMNKVMKRLQALTYDLLQRKEVCSQAFFVVSLMEEAAGKQGIRQEVERQAVGAVLQLFAVSNRFPNPQTTSVLTTFMLAMMLHPETFWKARAEIDQVIGNSRLPNFNDRTSLPFLEWVIKETYRHVTFGLNVCVTGIPHRTSNDDIYGTYYIPRGTTVMANIWSMSSHGAELSTHSTLPPTGRCPEIWTYPDPEVFRPERFQEMEKTSAEKADPRRMIFGFGRRICPGRHLADANVWILVASIISVFDIAKAHDPFGNEISPTAKMEPDSHPEPFACEIRDPSSKAMELIRQAENISVT